MSDLLYSADDVNEQPTTSADTFVGLNTVVAAATGDTVEGAVNFESTVDSAWRKIAPELHHNDSNILQGAAASGNDSLVEHTARIMANRVAMVRQGASATYDEIKQKTTDLAQKAIENISTTNEAVVINNSIDDLANSQVVDGEEVAKLLRLEEKVVNATKLSKLQIAGGILHELTPIGPFQGAKIQSILTSNPEKYGITKKDVNLFTSRNELITLLQNHFKYSVPSEKKLEWLSSLIDDMDGTIFTNKLEIANFIGAITNNEPQEINGWDDWLDRIGVGLIPLQAAGVAARVGTKLAKATAYSNAARKIATVGGKGSIEAAEAAKVAQAIATRERIGAAGIVVSEATGVSAVMDLAKLVSVGASKVLPDAITTSAGAAQAQIRGAVNKLIDELQGTVAAKSVSAADALEELNNLKRVYSTANNPNIHNAVFGLSDDGLSVVGKVYYKPNGASAFLTKEAAEEAARVQFGGQNVSVVPDTTNTGFLVEEDVVKNLQLERDALVASLIQPATTLKRTRKSSKTKTEGGEGVGTTEAPKTIVEPPKALVSSKPKFGLPQKLGSVDLTFEDSVDKAAYQLASKTKPSKSDAEVLAWVKNATGWSDEQVKAHGMAVREAIKTAAKNVDVVDSLSYTVPSIRQRMGTDVPKGRDSVGTSNKLDDVVITNLFNNKYNYRRIGNTLMSPNVHNKVDLFVIKMAKALGMEDHGMVVLQMSDLIKSTEPELKAIAEYMNKHHINAGALFYPVHGKGSIIIMRNDAISATKTNTFKPYIETFAHEYGHAFEHVFQYRYSAIMKSNYKKWLRSKGIKGDDVLGQIKIAEAFPLEAMLEYRAITVAEQLTSFVDRYFAGDVAAWKQQEAAMRAWASSYSEFFAEQFAKWSFTDEVPTTILGEAFTSIINGFKFIANEIRNLLKAENIAYLETADVNTARMLNEHVKLVKENFAFYKNNVQNMSKVSEQLKPSVDSINQRIAQIDEQLAAIDAAKRGLKHGWLIQHNISSTITYDRTARYLDSDINSATQFALGDWALSTSSEQYTKRLVGTHSQSRYNKLLTDFIRKDVEKLSRQERVALNDVLVRGDQEGKVYTEAELAGSNINQKTRVAYFKIRALRDIMHQVRNDAVSKVLTRKGFVDLNFVPGKLAADTTRMFGRQVNSIETVRNKIVYNFSESKTTRVGEDFFEKLGDNSLYELAQPIQVGTKRYNYVIVRNGDVNPKQITSAIPYRTGEYSRQYTDEYWVKIDTAYEVDGAVTSSRLTHRTAATSNQAKAYAKAFNQAVQLYNRGALGKVEAAALMEPYGWNAEVFIKALQDKQFGDAPNAAVYYNRTDGDFLDSSVSVGGILGKQRGERVLNVFGQDNILNPLDSIASEISNTAYVASTLDWRESHIYKWFYTFRDDLPAHVQNMTPEKAFAEMLKMDGYMGSNKRLQVAEKVQKYIIDQMNIPTSEERYYLGKARQLSEKFENAVDTPAMHKVGMLMRQSSNWPMFVRTVAFHSYMGMFNLKHLFMQSMNAFNAISINPRYGFPSAQVGSLYGLALFSDSEDIWRSIATSNKLATLGVGMDVDEFVESVRMLRRTGLLDGINFNSMWGAEGGKYGLFNGFTRRLGAVSAAPFNLGDGYARIVSFEIARREWKAANPGKAWWTDDAAEEILARQDDLTQNMTKANTTFWQKGVLSLPLQFTQYQVKIALNIIQSLRGNERTFSRKEAVNLFIGHTLLLGTAGWGILPDEWLEGITKDLTEAERTSLTQGVVAGIISQLTGEELNLAIGSTFGTFNYYREIFQGLVDPEKTMVEALGGPGGFAVFRWMGQTADAMKLFYYGGINEESTKAALLELGRGFSSINNATKAYIAFKNFNELKTNYGVSKYKLSDLELYAQSIGINSVSETDLQTLFKSSKDYRDGIKEVGKELARYRMLAHTAKNAGDNAGYENYLNVINMILITYKDDPQAYQELYRISIGTAQGTQLERQLIEQMQRDFQPRDLLVNTNPYKE